MKKKLLVSFVLLVIVYNNLFGQKIQYSRGVVPVDNPEKMQLVANIGGYHHLLSFGLNKKPAIYVFNPQLQLVQKKEIDISQKKDYDLRIASFPSHYFIYTHALGTSKHDLWKIDGKGTITLVSEKFQNLVDSFFRKTTATLQLVNQEKSLFVVAHTYYDSLKLIKCTVAQLDDNLLPVMIHKVVYPFNRENEFLQQTTIANDHLYVLKTGRDDEKGNTLEIIKIDLNGGRSVMNSFNSSSHEYSEPAFRLNNDSSVLVYSMIKEPSFTHRIVRAVFIVRLDNELKEQTPFVTLKSQLGLNTLTNFLYLGGQQSQWVCIRNYTRMLRWNTGRDEFSSINRIGYGYSYMTNLSESNYSFGVKFSVLDQKFEVKKDSLVSNAKRIMDIEPYPFGQFNLNNKGYLVLVQNFAPKRKGLTVFTADESNHFSTIGLPVYDRNEYLLNKLQTIEENYFIVPFTYRNEMGLLKVAIKNIEDMASN